MMILRGVFSAFRWVALVVDHIEIATLLSVLQLDFNLRYATMTIL